MMRWITKLASRFMATCQETTEHCTDLSEGALSDVERTRVHRHLKLCGACRAYQVQMETGVRALHELPREELSGPEKDELLRRFRVRQAR
jgi:predicted anti-sigma-YlaC factor YlaD